MVALDFSRFDSLEWVLHREYDKFWWRHGVSIADAEWRVRVLANYGPYAASYSALNSRLTCFVVTER